MNHIKALVLSAAAMALVTVATTAVAATPKPKIATVKGAYTGKVTEKVDGSNVSALTAGIGAITVVGKGKLVGTVTGTTANPPCSPLAGSGSITGPKGNLKVTLASTSRACAASEDDQNNITVSGNAKVTGGTLQFKKAKGTIHFSGPYDRKAGTFSVKFTGKLTY